MQLFFSPPPSHFSCAHKLPQDQCPLRLQTRHTPEPKTLLEACGVLIRRIKKCLPNEAFFLYWIADDKKKMFLFTKKEWKRFNTFVIGSSVRWRSISSHGWDYTTRRAREEKNICWWACRRTGRCGRQFLLRKKILRSIFIKFFEVFLAHSKIFQFNFIKFPPWRRFISFAELACAPCRAGGCIKCPPVARLAVAFSNSF